MAPALGADDRREQLVLAGEVGVERGLGDAGLARDRIHAGAAVALLPEDAARRLQHLLGLGTEDGARGGRRPLAVIGVVTSSKLNGSVLA